MRDVSTVPLTPASSAGVLALVEDAWRSIPGVHVLLAVAFGLAWGLANSFGWWLTGSSDNVARTTAYLTYEALLPMMLLVPAIAIADALAVRQSRRVAPYVPYVAAALAAALGGELLFALTAPLLGLGKCACTMDAWVQGARTANMLPDSLLICGFITAGYCYRRRSLERFARLHAVQLERAQLTRRTMESRLQAMQACIEPEFLFDTLAQVEQLHATDAKGAGRMLDDLIVYLRAALPQLKESTSTVGKECELVCAYLNIRRMGATAPVSFDIAVAADAQDARMPPMILLPLVDHARQCALQSALPGGALRIGFGIAHGTLRMTLGYDGAGFLAGASGETEIAGIRDRLAALYGARARAELRIDDRQGTHLTLEIPHECADGDPR